MLLFSTVVSIYIAQKRKGMLIFEEDRNPQIPFELYPKIVLVIRTILAKRRPLDWSTLGMRKVEKFYRVR